MKPINQMNKAELTELMNRLATLVRGNIPEKTFFMMLVGDDLSEMQYVSNSNRQDVIQAMRECADRLERKEDRPRINLPEQAN